jgi:dUTP pyrophosphatase
MDVYATNAENFLSPRDGDVGYDIKTNEDVFIAPGETRRVSTGVRLDLTKTSPPLFGIVIGRSSVSAKGVDIFGGLIDNGYTGEIIVVMHNSSSGDILFEAGSKIAQLVFFEAKRPEVNGVEEIEVITLRGEKGFGSTGA